VRRAPMCGSVKTMSDPPQSQPPCRSDGKIMQRVSTPSAHQGLSFDAEGILTARLHTGGPLRFRAEGFDGDRPKLEPVRR